MHTSVQNADRLDVAAVLPWYRQDNRYQNIKPATQAFQVDVYAVNTRMKKYLWPGETFSQKELRKGNRMRPRMVFVGRKKTPVINDPKFRSIDKILRGECMKYELKKIPWPRKYGHGYDEFSVPSLREGYLVLIMADYLLRLVETAHRYMSIHPRYLPPWYTPDVVEITSDEDDDDTNVVNSDAHTKKTKEETKESDSDQPILDSSSTSSPFLFQERSQSLLSSPKTATRSISRTEILNKIDHIIKDLGDVWIMVHRLDD